MAGVALFDFVRPSSVDSDCPLSHCSSHSASSVSLMSMISSFDGDYHSCIDEMASEESSSDEFLFDEADLEELGIMPETEMNKADLGESVVPLEAEVDDQPSTILIYSTVAMSPLLFSSPLPPLSVTLPETADQAVQSGEHDFLRWTGSATIVVWDPRLPNSFPPTCRTSILPPWWQSEECVGTFGFPAYQQLSKEFAARARFVEGHPQSDDIDGGDVWNLSTPESLPQQMRRLNYVRHHRIAVLTGEADREFAAAATAAAAAIALAEAAEVGEFLPDDSEDDIIWQDETIWLEGYRMPTINACPQIQQLLPRFIPGRGFAQYLVCPALCAHAPFYLPPYVPPSLTPPRRVLLRPVCAFERPDHVSPLEMVLSKDDGVFLKLFLEIVTEALVKEFGMPPYPQYIAQHLPLNFLISPTESEPAPAVELTPQPAPEPEESTVEIEWDSPTEPIGFLRFARSASEQPEARAVSPTTTIVPTAMVQQLVATHPALTSVTKHHPAPTDRLTEQNTIVATSHELPPIVCLCLILFHPPEQVDIAPPIATDVVSQTMLIVDNHSPLYNANGYKVSQVYATVTRLRFTLTPEHRFRSHRSAHLTHRSETEGIPMRLPLDVIFQPADLLMLWTCYETRYNCPLVASFVIHDAALFRLRVVISLAYDTGRLILFSQPESEQEDRMSVQETLHIQLANTDLFHYHVVFICDECHDDQWQFLRLQPTLLSPCVALVELKCTGNTSLDAGIFCLGPSDPWDTAGSANSAQVVYWIPWAIYDSALPAAHGVFHAQASHCPLWAFSTPFYNVHFLVHCLL